MGFLDAVQHLLHPVIAGICLARINTFLQGIPVNFCQGIAQDASHVAFISPNHALGIIHCAKCSQDKAQKDTQTSHTENPNGSLKTVYFKR